ncbi:MAG: ATP-binding cassette domain-containing protein [Nitriliruptorales bacterium]|nr:ATP-binding cassette domain-containing protein [Nitriliruptorales bacterium]
MSVSDPRSVVARDDDRLPPGLHVRALSSGYGPTQALWNATLHVRPGEAVALIGANGAGKTTLLRAIAGQLPAWTGAVSFAGVPLAGVPTHRRVAAGIVMVPEGRQLFAGLTVRENLLMGAYARADESAVAADLTRVHELFPRLADRRDQLAGHLSGGEQQMCAIGRALMSRPRLLMIDELSLGLAPVIVDRLIDVIAEIHREGMTLLIVEQDVGTALAITERGYLLESGHLTLGGSRQQLERDPRVQESFIGI